MFPGSSSSNPFTYTNSTTLENTFENDGKGSLGQEEHLSCYSNLLAPFLEDDELLLSHLLSQQQLLFCGTSQAQTENSVAASNKATDTEKEASGNTVAEQIPSERSLTKKKSSSGTKQRDPSKRTGKKDRHSKICTAQGPRDRRMRLSLQTARKFFDLQDMLGFDKASKTIEWLFSKSMLAIKELTQNISQMKRSSSEDGAKSVSVTSDSEVVSQNVDGEQTGFVADGEIFNCITVERTNRKFHRVARDSRDKARARARERTREKLMIKGLEISQISEGPNPNNLGQLWSSRALETDRESCFRFHEAKCSLKMAAEVDETTNHLLEHQIDSVSINSKLLGFVGAPSKSSLTFNYSHNASSSNRGNCEDDLSGFPGNWVNSDDLQSLCRRTTNMKPPAGNVQVKFPAAIPTVTSRPQELKPSTMTFASTYNCQERILHSVYMTTPTAQEENPRSISITSNSQQQNPNSNNYASSNNQLYSHFLEEQFS